MVSTEKHVVGRQGVVHIRSKADFDAICSTIRLSIVEYFRSRGPMSVAELAEHLERPADGLYHHLRKLEARGMIREVGTRQRGRQIERIYDATADEYRVAEDATELVRVWRLISSFAERNLAAAIEGERLRFRGEGRNSAMRVETAQLDARSLAEVLEHIEAIRSIFSSARENPTGESVTLTYVLSPTVAKPGMSRGEASGTREARNPKGSGPKNTDGAARSGRKKS